MGQRECSAAGKLAGDELRSFLETAPYLMKQLADGFGVPVGSLNKLGEEAKLTADVERLIADGRAGAEALAESDDKWSQTVIYAREARTLACPLTNARAMPSAWR